MDRARAASGPRAACPASSPVARPNAEAPPVPARRQAPPQQHGQRRHHRCRQQIDRLPAGNGRHAAGQHPRKQQPDEHATLHRAHHAPALRGAAIAAVQAIKPWVSAVPNNPTSSMPDNSQLAVRAAASHSSAATSAASCTRNRRRRSLDQPAATRPAVPAHCRPGWPPARYRLPPAPARTPVPADPAVAARNRHWRRWHRRPPRAGPAGSGESAWHSWTGCILKPHAG